LSQNNNDGAIEILQLSTTRVIKHPVSFKRYYVYDPNSAKKARLDIFLAWLKEEAAI